MDNAPLVRASYTADAGKGLRLSEMCTDILNIKFDMLSRYQYKENYTNTTLSVKS